MKIIAIVISSIFMASCSTTSVNLHEGVIYNFPTITEPITIDQKTQKIVFLLRYRNFVHNEPNTAFVYEYLPSSVLPQETLNYTRQTIWNRFLTQPEGIADRFWGVSLSNYKKKCVLDLLFTQEVDQSNKPTGNWIYYLSVSQTQNSKSFEIANYTLSAEGKIIPNYEYMW